MATPQNATTHITPHILSAHEIQAIQRHPLAYRGKMSAHGNMSTLDNIRLGIIGSRLFTDYGYRVLEQCIATLCDFPISIISGGAPGIDTLALQFANKFDLDTIHMPGYSINKYMTSYGTLSTAETKQLYISTIDEGHASQRWHFLIRNQALCSLCDAILVIEGAEDSGTAYTIAFALKHHIPLLAIPGSILSSSYTACNQAIAKGGTIITRAEDICTHLSDIAHLARTREYNQSMLEASTKYLIKYLTNKNPETTIHELAELLQENPLSISAILHEFESEQQAKLANIQNT